MFGVVAMMTMGLTAEPASVLEANVLAELKVSGCQRLSETLVRRELSLQPGAPVAAAALQADRDRLMRTNLFSKVETQLEPTAGNGPLRAIVRIEENAEVAITGFGLGYSSSRGLVGGLSLAHWNLFGTGQQAGFGLYTGPAGWPTGELAYMNPWLDGGKTGLGGTLFRRTRGNAPANVDELHLGGRVFATRPVFGAAPGSPFLATAGLQGEQVSAFEPTAEARPVAAYADGRPVTLSAQAVDTVIAGTMGLTFDTRTPLRGDDRFNQPTDGWLGTLMAEPTLINGASPLVRVTGGLNRYFPIPVFWSAEPSAFVLAGRFGSLLGPAVPAYKKFASADTYDDAPTASVTGNERLVAPFLVRGSAFSPNADVRAYLMPRAQFSGTNALVTTAEYRFPVYGPVSGVGFLDYGVFWDDQFLLDLFHIGYGAGVRVQTPIGLLRLDCGLSGYLPPQLHFGIGHKI